MKKILRVICALLLGVGSVQAQSTFNPENPDEPQVPIFYYPMTVTCNPSGAAYTIGNGSYVPGTQVVVSTSPFSGYTFDHWELNGTLYDTDGADNFIYTTVAGKMDFVAVYQFTPNAPSEPTLNVKSRLYLTSEPEGVCTFNRASGDWVEADQYVEVDVTGVNQLFAFDGWYLNGSKLADVQDFNYLADYHDTTLTAHFRSLPFQPANPDEPQMAEGQESVENGSDGDVNADGEVNVSDVVMVINMYLDGDDRPMGSRRADVNGDGVINITDVVCIINLYLTNQ